MGLFDRYFDLYTFDEMVDDAKEFHPHWREIVGHIDKAGLEGLRAKQHEIDWYLEENGVTYNVYNNPEGDNKRRWSLDPIPFVIRESEWEEVAKGLQQRAKLMNLIFRDLYGEQTLLKENIIPAEVVFGHKGYATEVYNFGAKENFHLYFYAADMARGPDGKMWVINDRTQAPSGLGYTIENRLSMNSIAKELYPTLKTRKLVGFIEELKQLIRRLGGDDRSMAALLTPGPHNETYFEHAYLSSLLELNLVQGEDLLAKNGSLWLKKLSGLTKINTLIRRVDDRFCDPLELRHDSHLGVAGLVEAMRQDHLNMINPVGSAILENLGLNPFMSKCAEFLLDEELILPQIATWWCGQPKELEYVLEHLEELIVKKIDRTEGTEAYFGKHLTPGEREELAIKMLQNPHQYVAQEEIGFSTAPFFDGESIEPRNAIIRAYALKGEKEYSVMNGGLVRVSAAKDALLVSTQEGGTSKDLWILSEGEEAVPLNPFQHLPFVNTSIDAIPTLRAENLFWLGRYLARSIVTVRLMRYVLKKMINSYPEDEGHPTEARNLLLQSLTHLTMTYPGFLGEEEETEKERKKRLANPMKELLSVIRDPARPGSLAFTVLMLSNANVNTKNLLAIESWKLFDKMVAEWNAIRHMATWNYRGVVNELDRLHIYLMAYKELVEESMFKEQGLILYDIGFKIESGLLLISQSRALLCHKLEKAAEYEVLEAMLNASESFNAYRASYKSTLMLENVVEFLLLNPQFPKSLTCRADQLLEDFHFLPKSTKYLSSYEEPIFEAYSRLKLADVKKLLSDEKEEDLVHTGLNHLLAKQAELFIDASDELSKTYFSHSDE